MIWVCIYDRAKPHVAFSSGRAAGGVTKYREHWALEIEDLVKPYDIRWQSIWITPEIPRVPSTPLGWRLI